MVGVFYVSVSGVWNTLLQISTLVTDLGTTVLGLKWYPIVSKCFSWATLWAPWYVFSMHPHDEWCWASICSPIYPLLLGISFKTGGLTCYSYLVARTLYMFWLWTSKQMCNLQIFSHVLWTSLSWWPCLPLEPFNLLSEEEGSQHVAVSVSSPAPAYHNSVMRFFFVILCLFKLLFTTPRVVLCAAGCWIIDWGDSEGQNEVLPLQRRCSCLKRPAGPTTERWPALLLPWGEVWGPQSPVDGPL